MRFTERMGLKMPDQDDAYQVEDFNGNTDKISKYFAAKPVLTSYKNLTEFIRSGKAAGFKLGDTVAIHDIIYILVADNPLSESSWMPYGAEALVVMEQYIPVAERHNGSLYLEAAQRHLGERRWNLEAAVPYWQQIQGQGHPTRPRRKFRRLFM